MSYRVEEPYAEMGTLTPPRSRYFPAGAETLTAERLTPHDIGAMGKYSRRFGKAERGSAVGWVGA